MTENEESKENVLEQDVSGAFQNNYQHLLHVANRVLENREEAEDVVSTVFLKLTKSPPKGFIKNPGGYLHQAVLNEAVSFRRSRNCRDTRDRAFYERQTQAPVITSHARGDMSRRLMEAKSQLELADVALLTLRYEMDLSSKEIAELLGRTRAGIVMSMMRAERRIRKLIDGAAEAPRKLTQLNPNAGEMQ